MCLTRTEASGIHWAMTLGDYLLFAGYGDAWFAALVGVDRTTISRLRRGNTRPTWEVAAKIVEATNGAVTPNDFLPLRAPSAKRTKTPGRGG
jgi:DNA-binding XRE family transcriptional regulator